PQQGDAGMGCICNRGELSRQRSHVLAVMDEDIEVAGPAMPEIRSGERGTAAEVTRDQRLAGTDQIEGEIRDDPAIEGPSHRPHGSGARGATPAAGAPAARPTSLVNAQDTGRGAATARGFRRPRRRARRPWCWLPAAGRPSNTRALRDRPMPGAP